MVSHVFYEGPSRLDGGPIVVLAAGITTPSVNRKTGPMVQVYILRADKPVWDSLRDGSDESICGDCIHRPKTYSGGKARDRSCYVDLRFVSPVWFAKRVPGQLAAVSGRAIRFGAYGDPMAAPLDVWVRFAQVATNTCGYTQFWDGAPPGWSNYLMASVHSAEDAERAREQGWRTYRDRYQTEPVAAKGEEVDCPHFAKPEIQCIDCKLCNGSQGFRDKRRSIVAPIHGGRKKHRDRTKEAQRSLPLVEAACKA